MGTFSHMYVDGGSSAQTIQCGSPRLMTGFATAGEQSTQFGDLGSQITIDSDKITVVRGIYLVSFNCSGFTDVTYDLMDIIAKMYTNDASESHFAAIAGFSARASFGELDLYAHLGFNGIYEVTRDRCDLKIYLDATLPSSEESSSSESISQSSSVSSSSSESGETSSSATGETISFTPVHAQFDVWRIG